jgi:hypothetical protein
MKLIGTCLLVIGLVLTLTSVWSYRSNHAAAEDQIVGTSDYAGPVPVSPFAGGVIALAGAGILLYSRRGRGHAHGPF